MPSFSSLRPTLKPVVAALDEERGDAAVAGRRIDGGEDDEDVGLARVGDPHLAAAQHVGVAIALGPRRQRERVAAGFRLGQRVGAERGRRETGQEGRLLRRRAPAQQRVDDQRVVDVDDHPDGRVDARQLFDGEGGVEERAAGAAVDLGHLDAHDAQREERPQQVAIERLLLVHGPRERGDPVHREVADAVAEEPLVVGERRKG